MKTYGGSFVILLVVIVLVTVTRSEPDAGYELVLRGRRSTGTTGTGWTKWYDRDDPSGTGDWENVSSFNKLCHGKTIVKARCKQLNSFGYFTEASVGYMPNVFKHNCTVTGGLVCLNADNIAVGKPLCKDYAIRFYCEAKCTQCGYTHKGKTYAVGEYFYDGQCRRCHCSKDGRVKCSQLYIKCGKGSTFVLPCNCKPVKIQ